MPDMLVTEAILEMSVGVVDRKRGDRWKSTEGEVIGGR
jgi:hypothetical protein